MKISFDPAKRDKAFAERGLDFCDAPQVFAGPNFRWVDDQFDYGEERIITIGMLQGRMVVLVWTQRGDTRHIISLRKANDREQARYARQLDRP